MNRTNLKRENVELKAKVLDLTEENKKCKSNNNFFIGKYRSIRKKLAYERRKNRELEEALKIAVRNEER